MINKATRQFSIPKNKKSYSTQRGWEWCLQMYYWPCVILITDLHVDLSCSYPQTTCVILITDLHVDLSCSDHLCDLDHWPPCWSLMLLPSDHLCDLDHWPPCWSLMLLPSDHLCDLDHWPQCWSLMLLPSDHSCDLDHWPPCWSLTLLPSDHLGKIASKLVICFQNIVITNLVTNGRTHGQTDR